MTDAANVFARSRMMSRISAKDTAPELAIRTGLHKLGFRYRLHAKDLPGTPDIVLPKYRTVVMVNGCFWHRHRCRLFRWPKNNQQFWKDKLERNALRDKHNIEALLLQGWRVRVVWECAMRGGTALDQRRTIERLGRQIRSRRKFLEIEEKKRT